MPNNCPDSPDENAMSNSHRLPLLVNSITDYAVYLLDGEGRVQSWNQGAERIKGYTASEALGRHFSCFYTAEDRAAGVPEAGLAHARQHHTFKTEAWRLRKDGSRFWASVAIDAIYEKGVLVGFAKVTRDITDHKRAQEKSDRQREALHQAQKLEALGRLTGSVAHDFNNLLAIIRTAVELLQSRKTLTDEKREHYLDMIANTATRASTLIDQLLVFARRKPLRPSVFEPEARVRGIQQIIETSLGSRSSVTITFEPGTEQVQADPNQFETAMLNMIINARDAMPEGGRVTVRGRNATWCRVDDEGEDAFEDMVAISVTDTGEGIRPEVLQNIFEPFFTTKGVHKGTGLGLSQVYGFATQSGGDVTVESEPGKGTTFTLFLPVARRPGEQDDWDNLLTPMAQDALPQDPAPSESSLPSEN